MEKLDDAGGRRLAVCALLIVISVAAMGAQVARVRSQLGGSPLLSANDRSRWCTIRALVDHGTYAIDDVVMPGGQRDREWYTIDMVRHAGIDGHEHYYSSKPPLLPTLLAGLCWLLQRLFGLTLSDQPFFVVRIMLVLVNLVPLAAYFWLICRAAERWATTDWGRCFVVAVATFGTLVTTFSVTLSNHVPAVIGAAVTGYLLLRMTVDGRRGVRYFAAVGLTSAWTAANELPALMLVVLAGVVALRCDARRAAWATFLPALGVGIGFMATNYLAHGDWRPAYAHRADGPILGTVTVDEPSVRRKQQATTSLCDALRDTVGRSLPEPAMLRPRDEPRSWELSLPDGGRRFALQWEDGTVTVREWGDWYDYEGTYWQDSKKKGVDRGEANVAVYAFHLSLGHHGILSLSPVWLLAILGAALWLGHESAHFRWAAWTSCILTAICVGFYLSRPLVDRNYGGVSCGMRWTLWLIPFWLFCLLPAADFVSRSRWGRAFAWLTLAVSVFSATFNGANPWSHPWLFEYWSALGWIHYP